MKRPRNRPGASIDVPELTMFREHESPRLRFALCDPDGVPFYIGERPALCLGQYVDMRGGVILDDPSQEEYFNSMIRRGWTLRHIETIVTVRQAIVSVKELRRIEHEEDKAKERQDKSPQGTPRGRKGREKASGKTAGGTARKGKENAITPRSRATPARRRTP
jgi:hypothetical protein